MRRIRLLFWALALTFLFTCAQASDIRDYKEAEKLALEERYEEAVALMLPLPDDTSALAYHRLQALQGLCTTYSLWGKNAKALDACAQALKHHYSQNAIKCMDNWLRTRGKIPSQCPYTTEYETIAALKAWQALAYHRAGRKDEAQKSLTVAVRLGEELKTEIVFLSAIVAYITRTFPIFEMALRSRGGEKQAAQLEHMRIVLTYGGAGTPAARAERTARVLWAEHPHAKPAVYSVAAILLCTAIYIPARRRLNRMAAGLFSASGSLLTRAARSIPRRVNAWLHPARPAAPPPPVATPVATPSPAYALSPAPMPMYFNYRYPNQAYRIAGYCFAAFWIVLLGPLVVALLLPAFTLLSDFSTRGFQNAYSHFWHILNTSMAWARLWFALLLFSLLGFVGFKLYGRFSLPKPMRPPIRVVYGTLRFAFLGAILTAVGTFLSYFTAAFAGLYSNPIVRTLINALRKLLGF